jgi:NCS1 family nucleobase:cation symporter-1
VTTTSETPSDLLADQHAWPLLRSERNWGSWQLGISLATAAAATWCYLIGEYVGYYLGFIQGAVTLFSGSMIGILIVTLAAVPIAIRYGVDSIASTKPCFGSTGWVIPAGLQLISIIGWNSVLLIFFAKSTTQLLLALGLVTDGASAVIMPSVTLVACALVFLFLLKGSRGIDRISKALVAHVVIGLWMLFVLLSHRWADLSAAIPANQSPDPVWNYTTGVEIGIVSLLSWWPYIGAMVRMAPSGRKAVLPIMLGMGAPVPLLSLIGIAGILVLQVSDPSSWLRSIGGPVYGVVALLFVAAANLGTATAGVYASAIGLRHFAFGAKLAWPVLLLLTLLPVALVGLTIPELFFANFGVLLAFIGVCFGPLCGIQIADYYVLRRRRIDIRGLYLDEADGPYRFWFGVNPAALIAMAVGCATYIYLLDPVTYESHAPYQFTTASLPTVLIAGLIYVLATRLIVRPRGKGGYPIAD